MTFEEYDAAFQKERKNEYAAVDAVEARAGHAVARDRLENAAFVLACPLKANPPNWQHGRVIYALAHRQCLRLGAAIPVINMLDIGTAKGFSSLCMLWAAVDAQQPRRVVSVDVIDPRARVRRNTVSEVGGLRTLTEILEPWPETSQIEFHKATGVDWLRESTSRIHFAFVDGKHSYAAVSEEGHLLSQRQLSGDVAVFDDVHIAGVRKAVDRLKGYEIDIVEVLPTRAYAIATCH